MKTYFYVLPESASGPVGYGGFETLDAVKSEISEKILGGIWKRALVYSIDSETRAVEHEFTVDLEPRKVVWREVKKA